MAVWPENRRHSDLSEHRIAAWSTTVVLRLASPSDYGALEQLADRDSRRLPPGPHLLAERDGRIDAAISASTHELVADPFSRTSELCDLLRCHAGEVRVAPEHVRFARPAPRPELVPA
jgi:hypothetical protein